MHYYKRNIGDYAKKAGRLSMLQHGAYTLLIDSCYDREQFPTLEEAIEWTWASTKEEEEAVKFVLSRFFVLEDGLYIQKRIKEEVEAYKSRSEKNKQIAIDREAKRKKGPTSRERSVNGTPPNHKPITNNHKPIKENNKKKVSTKLDFTSWPNIPSDQILTDWKKLRSRLKANVTQTVINRMGKELNKAKDMGYSVDECLSECVFKGWRGFEAGWLKSKPDSFKTDLGEPF